MRYKVIYNGFKIMNLNIRNKSIIMYNLLFISMM